MANKRKAAVMYAHGKVIFRSNLTPIVLPMPCVLSQICTFSHMHFHASIYVHTIYPVP